MRGGIHPAGHEVVGDLGGVAHVRFNHHVSHDALFGGAQLIGQQVFVQAVVQVRKLARAIVFNQAELIEHGIYPLKIARVAAQAHVIFGEYQCHGASLILRIAAHGLGQLFDLAHGISPRREMAQDIFHALELFAHHQGFLELLKMERRAKIGVDVAHFIGGDHVR